MIGKCLVISFDFTKRDYPQISYSIASILAQFKNTDILVEQYSYNLNEFLSTPKTEIEERIQNDFQEKYLEKINDYAFIAIGAYAWSENLVNKLIEIIRPKFKGKIILGGYEITALSKEELLQHYPDADFYIKGYAEKALEKIFKNETIDKVVDEKIDGNISSPYLSGVLPLDTKKIHWESKRGCPYHCDFCEHGAANDKDRIIRINKNRLEEEISLFRKNKVKEINVLDATFLIKDEDNDILERLLSIDSCKNICLQMHFSTIKSEKGKRFLEICQKHKDRISLEFGLQTIHEEEMEILNRKNDIRHVEKVMKQLNDAEIKYSISIIFGIPYQTVESFKQTIEFIEKNGCKEFQAYPLQLPKNSNMRKKIKELEIEEFEGSHFSLRFVKKSCSFDRSGWEKMYKVADSYSEESILCGGPIETLKPISKKIELAYLNGGIHCKIESKQPNCGRSIFLG